jgi:hypothetical protein
VSESRKRSRRQHRPAVSRPPAEGAGAPVAEHDHGHDARGAHEHRTEAPGAPRRRGSAWVELAMILGAFVLATLVAELLGAINVGTALAFGQMALAATVVYIMLRRP